MPDAPQRRGSSEVVSGRRAVEELLGGGGGAQKVLIARDRASASSLGRIRRLAEARSIPVRVVPRDELDRVARDLNHQGVAALTSAFRYADLDELLSASVSKLLFLDRVTDPHNLGSLLRSADGAGFGGIVLPSHGAAPVTDAVRRVSSGAAEVVPVARAGNLGQAIDRAKAAGLWIVGLDAAGDGELWSSEMLEPPVALVLGSEETGLRPSIVKRCDALVRIPVTGRLASLNVAVAGAIAMFEVARRGSGSHIDDRRSRAGRDPSSSLDGAVESSLSGRGKHK